MFAILFRIGSEYHDVYSYGEWMSMTLTDEDVVSFDEAYNRATEAIIALFMGDEEAYMVGTWQIRSIERVDEEGWPSEYVL